MSSDIPSSSYSVFLNTAAGFDPQSWNRNRCPENLYPNGSTIDGELVLQDYGLDEIPLRWQVAQEEEDYHPHEIHTLNLTKNVLVTMQGLSVFANLKTLDVSNNSLTVLPEDIGSLKSLTTIVARNNLLEQLPKSLFTLENLESLFLAGNRFDQFPQIVYNLRNLHTLHLGGNLIENLPSSIGSMQSLEVLYLGGNRLTEIPATIGCMSSLQTLALCDNQLETIPSTLGDLDHLESLTLHNNKLRTLPTEILNLQNLQSLSLRNNPLVHNFVHNMMLGPPSLKELSGRIVRQKMTKLPLQEILPIDVIQYLNSACQCVNPKCKGVYFDARVEHVKFVDFCGKYRVPLLQFLCSPRCSSGVPAVQSDTSSESEEEFEPRMRRVLLG